MDFFKFQDQAKSQTFWLVILFCVGLIILPYIGAHIITFSINLFIEPKNRLPSLFILTLISLTSITLLVSLYKYISLRQGGKVVAIALGGRLIDKKAANANERRLLNVIEEMAIASSLPVPHVYVLDEEININAFAAGHTINDAIIGVTRGSVELLTRDELQAVIAHEFSHILNGDMRLNLKFTSLLFGFNFVTQAGYILFRLAFTGEGEKKGVIPHLLIISVALLAAGSLGQVWSRIMQAAVNRQREYLADASAVQFTRHGKALASALKKIGGSTEGASLTAATASTYSHFFFGQADASFLATHPPLKKRIKRIEPWWLGGFIKPDFSKLIKQEQPEEIQENKTIKDKKLTAAIVAGMAITGTDALPYVKPVTLLTTDVNNEQQAIAKLDAICQEPMDACYLMFALLLDTIPSIRAKQFTAIRKSELVIDYYQTLSLVAEDKYLEFVEKAIPSLKNLSAEQYKKFKSILMHFIQADQVISLREWLLYQLITHQVDGQFNPKEIAKSYIYNNLDQIKDEAATMLSAIVYLTEDATTQKQAFGLGSNVMGLYTIQLQEKPSITELTESLQKLQRATEAVRRRFLQGVLRAIEQDVKITLSESVFFRVLSLCIDCPMPTLTNIVIHK